MFVVYQNEVVAETICLLFGELFLIINNQNVTDFSDIGQCILYGKEQILGGLSS